jgi:hypothetical protein
MALSSFTNTTYTDSQNYNKHNRNPNSGSLISCFLSLVEPPPRESWQLKLPVPLNIFIHIIIITIIIIIVTIILSIIIVTTTVPPRYCR